MPRNEVLSGVSPNLVVVKSFNRELSLCVLFEETTEELYFCSLSTHQGRYVH